jgi:hypothetical protein
MRSIIKAESIESGMSEVMRMLLLLESLLSSVGKTILGD